MYIYPLKNEKLQKIIFQSSCANNKLNILITKKSDDNNDKKLKFYEKGYDYYYYFKYTNFFN